MTEKSVYRARSHIQLLQDDRCLLVTGCADDDTEIYLERFLDMEKAVKERRIKKTLNWSRLGRVLLAFDETKRMLVVCSIDKVRLTLFIILSSLDRQPNSCNCMPSSLTNNTKHCKP